MTTKWHEDSEIKLFLEYLRIPSVQPNVDYEPCIEFLRKQAIELSLEFRIESPVTPKKPIVILTWIGTQPELKSIILNSHMDVVPVFEEHWTHNPFSADIDEEGKIYARGSQDMKCVGTQYLAAIRHFKKNGTTFKRTIHLTFVAEEEQGGVDGMRVFAFTDQFKALNAGFSLDEGIASENEVFNVFYAERSTWHIKFVVNGSAGHGSLFLKNTPGEKVRYLLDKFFDFRASQAKGLKSNPNMTTGDVTSLNLTQISGGKQSNVVPPQFELVVDTRLAIYMDHKEYEATFRRWCEEAGGDITMEFINKEPYVEPTKIDNSNKYWTAFQRAVDDLNLKINVKIFPAGTDSRYIRRVGIPAIGFSPMNNTPVLLHDNDEYLQADVYLKGIEIYKTIIKNVADV